MSLRSSMVPRFSNLPTPSGKLPPKLVASAVASFPYETPACNLGDISNIHAVLVHVQFYDDIGVATISTNFLLAGISRTDDKIYANLECRDPWNINDHLFFHLHTNAICQLFENFFWADTEYKKRECIIRINGKEYRRTQYIGDD